MPDKYDNKYELSLTRGELWLMEAVVETSTPLFTIVEPNLEELNKTRGHGLDRAALVSTLDKLIKRRWIHVMKDISSESEDMYFPDSRDEIDNLLQYSAAKNAPIPMAFEKYAQYALTEEGGAQWERFTCPYWDYYLTCSSDETGTDGIIECGSKELMDEWLQDAMHSNFIDAQSFEWEIIKPWEPIYWKPPFDIGHRLRLYGMEVSDIWHGGPWDFMHVYSRRWCSWIG